MALQEPEVQTGFVELAISTGSKIRAEIQKLPLKKLKLDPHNVRFHHRPELLADDKIEEEIWKENDTRLLYREIIASGGLSEPPIVNSNLTVIEGNRRIVCYRKLSDKTHKGDYPDMAQDHWDTVTCYVLPKDTPDRDIAILLGRLHVSGKKEWAAVNQAAHMFDLYDKYGAIQDDIGEYLSKSKATVNYMIRAFAATNDYGKKYPADKAWIYKFSYFFEVYKKKSLREWIELNGNIDKFMDWIGKGRLTVGMQVRELPRIIDNADALRVLETSGFNESLKVLQKSDPAIGNKFYQHVSGMIEELNSVPRDELLDAGKDEAKVQALQRLKETVDEVLRNISAIKER